MSELMDFLRQREVDFVLAFKPTHPLDGIESHILFQNYLSAIVRPTHSLASKEKITLEDLERYDLALPSRGLNEYVTPIFSVPACKQFKSAIRVTHISAS